jgi:hypothetical protein
MAFQIGQLGTLTDCLSTFKRSLWVISSHFQFAQYWHLNGYLRERWTVERNNYSLKSATSKSANALLPPVMVVSRDAVSGRICSP